MDLTAHRTARDAGAPGEAAAEDAVDAAQLGQPGLRYAHLLGRPGAFGAELRYEQGGGLEPLRAEGLPLDDPTIANQACGPVTCTLTPARLERRDLRAEFLYGLRDGVTLMVAPSLVDRQVVLRPLQFFFEPIGPRGSSGIGVHSGGGLGDTEAAALVRLLSWNGQSLVAGIGVSSPTGRAGVRLNAENDYAPYALQLGSGSWDLLPSLTLSGRVAWLSWGAQAAAVERLSGLNSAGYRLGDVFRATAWGGVSPLPWLSLTTRGLYVDEGAIEGPTDGGAPHTISSPLDLPGNYGGKSWDVGVGLTAVVPAGALKGDFMAVEWLQPVKTVLKGYQMAPTGKLELRIGVAF